MIGPAKIDPQSWYDENTLFTLGFSTSVLNRARKAGTLRSRQAGRNGRTIYLGQWVIDWLTRDDAPTQADREPAAVAS